MAAQGNILVFDSGLGGLTVYREIVAARPDADFLYVADDAGFPYGALAEPRAGRPRRRLDRRPDRGTSARSRRHRLQYRLDHRAAGLAQEIHAAFCRHRAGDQAGLRGFGHARVSVLGTEATVRANIPARSSAIMPGIARSRSSDRRRSPLRRSGACAARRSATTRCRAEIAPCFRDDGARTDTVVLACTHYPLLIERLRRLAPGRSISRSGAGDRAAGRSICSVRRPRRRRHEHARFSPPATRPQRCSRVSASVPASQPRRDDRLIGLTASACIRPYPPCRLCRHRGFIAGNVS